MSWIRQLFWELGFEQNQPTVVFEDNQACIKMAENPLVSQRTKHIDIIYHFVRECVLRGLMEIQYIESEKQLADLHTNALARVVFERLCTRYFACYFRGGLLLYGSHSLELHL